MSHTIRTVRARDAHTARTSAVRSDVRQAEELLLRQFREASGLAPADLIGRGSYGGVYTIRGDPGKVVKLEADDEYPSLPVEAGAYEHLRMFPGEQITPRFLDFFSLRDGYALVIERALCSLADVLDAMKPAVGRSSIPCGAAKLLCASALDKLATLHNVCGLLHRDIKPENLLLQARGSRTTELMFTDLAMCKPFMSGLVHIERDNRHKVTLGNARYASPSQHQRLQHCRADEVVSMLHTFMFAVCGKLPWTAVGVRNEAKYLACKQRPVPRLGAVWNDLRDEAMAMAHADYTGEPRYGDMASRLRASAAHDRCDDHCCVRAARHRERFAATGLALVEDGACPGRHIKLDDFASLVARTTRPRAQR